MGRIAPNTIRTLIALGAVASTTAAQSPVPSAAAPSGPTWRSLTPPTIGPPPLRFEPAVLDLGDLPPGTSRAATVSVTNAGATPLTIASVQTSCHCTTGSLARSTLAPGESTSMAVILEAGDLVSPVTRRVDLMVDGYSQPASLTVAADVHYGVRPRLLPDPPGQSHAGTLTLESASGTPFRVLGVQGRAPDFIGAFNPETDPARTRYEVRWSLPALEAVPRWLVVETDHPDSPIIDIPLPGWSVPRVATPWTVDPPRLMLGEVGAGESRVVLVTIRGEVGDPLLFLESMSVDPPGGLSAELLGMSREEGALTLRVRVTAARGAGGLALDQLVLRAGGHDQRVVLMGRILTPGGTREPVPE